MTFEGDDGSIDIPDELYAGEAEAALAPVFAGEEMHAEVIRSMLEAHGIPAVVFGPGHEGGLSSMPGSHRVMVRTADVGIALEAIEGSEVDDGEVVYPDEEDVEVLVPDDGGEPAEDFEAEPGEEWAGVDVLAETRSDWGLRLVGLLGVAALIAAVIIFILQTR